MRLIPTAAPGWAPAGAPKVRDPVLAVLDVPVYYVGSGHPERQSRLFCGLAFAQVVLALMERLCRGYGLGIAHLGVYAPRYARAANGKTFWPRRWSNHARAEAMDFAGIVTADGQHLSIREMRVNTPGKLEAILAGCREVIQAAGRRAEIVHEGHWVHVGLWPAVGPEREKPFMVIEHATGEVMQGDVRTWERLSTGWPVWELVPGGDHRHDQGKVYLQRGE